MKGLVLHPLTKQHLDAYAQKPSHALLLVGPTGSGKMSLARSLSEILLGLSPDQLDNYPHKLIINAGDNKSIGIEDIRQLEHFLNLKVPSNREVNRVIIIENASILTIEAQNALLKTLEEPPMGTAIVMTANSQQSLLPTVISRTQIVDVKKPQQSELAEYFKAQGHNEEDIKRVYVVSAGLTGLMHAMLNESDHPLTKATDKARELLSQTVYQRLLSVDELSKDKELAINTVNILQQMASLSLKSSTGKSSDRWQTVLAASYRCSEALSNSAQPKLALTDLMLNL